MTAEKLQMTLERLGCQADCEIYIQRGEGELNPVNGFYLRMDCEDSGDPVQKLVLKVPEVKRTLNGSVGSREVKAKSEKRNTTVRAGGTGLPGESMSA